MDLLNNDFPRFDSKTSHNFPRLSSSAFRSRLVNFSLQFWAFTPKQSEKRENLKVSQNSLYWSHVQWFFMNEISSIPGKFVRGKWEEKLFSIFRFPPKKTTLPLQFRENPLKQVNKGKSIRWKQSSLFMDGKFIILTSLALMENLFCFLEKTMKVHDGKY